MFFVSSRVVVTFFLLLVACGSERVLPTAVPQATVPTLPPDAAAGLIVAATPAEVPAGRIHVRWQISGDGVTVQDPDFAQHQQIVADFNSSQTEIFLSLTVTTSTTPDLSNIDLVGPLRMPTASALQANWLTLNPLLTATDSGRFDPALLQLYQHAELGQWGLPFMAWPAILLVNETLFNQADLPLPPQQLEAPYLDKDGRSQPWNITQLRTLAMQLTLDANGRNATDPDFDHNNIVQYGFGNQWTDLRGRAALFGAGTLTESSGRVVLPPHWDAAMRFYHAAMWQDYFHPNGTVANSALLANGDWFASERVALALVPLWYLSCCIDAGTGGWQTAVPPSYNGQTTNRLQASSFHIPNSSSQAAAALQVMFYLTGNARLAALHGGYPAQTALQSAYLQTVAAQFPQQAAALHVIGTLTAVLDSPNYETALPQPMQARLAAFNQQLDSNPTLDVSTALAVLVEDLQVIAETE